MELKLLLMVATFVLPLILGLFLMFRGYRAWGSVLLLVAALCAPVGLVS